MWVNKLIGGLTTTTMVVPVLAVASAPGWNVIGAFNITAKTRAKLDVIASVSDSSLIISVRIYCVTNGSVGAVLNALTSLSNVTDTQSLSPPFTLEANQLYQVQAQVVGNAGDDYFGLVRRAAPVGV